VRSRRIKALTGIMVFDALAWGLGVPDSSYALHHGQLPFIAGFRSSVGPSMLGSTRSLSRIIFSHQLPEAPRRLLDVAPGRDGLVLS
jgi:hypothetical protein